MQVFFELQATHSIPALTLELVIQNSEKENSTRGATHLRTWGHGDRGDRESTRPAEHGGAPTHHEADRRRTWLCWSVWKKCKKTGTAREETLELLGDEIIVEECLEVSGHSVGVPLGAQWVRNQWAWYRDKWSR